MENKKIFIIGAHCSSLKDENVLGLLAQKIIQQGYEYIICSHTEVPPSVYTNSRYFCYDSFNDKNLNSASFLFRANSLFKIRSPFLNGSIFGHANAALDLLLSGILVAKRLGYSLAHWIEYDSSIDDFSKILENENDIISGEFDCVVYGSDSWIYPISGNFFSFNLEKIDLESVLIPLDKKREKMESCHFSSEYYIHNFLFGDLKIRNKKNSKDCPKNYSSQNEFRNWILVHDTEIDSLRLFLENETNDNWRVKIYTNLYSKEFELVPGQWLLETLGDVKYFSIKMPDDKVLDFDLSNREVYEKIVLANQIEYHSNE